MTEVTIDVDTVRRLFGSPNPVVIRDNAGKNLGTFVPSETFVRELYDWAWEQFKEESQDRSPQSGEGAELDDVWKRIQQKHRAAR